MSNNSYFGNSKNDLLIKSVSNISNNDEQDLIKNICNINHNHYNHNKKIKKQYYIDSHKINSPFNFLSGNVNIIDIRDYINLIDHHKLIQDAIKSVKDKDNKKLSQYFEKFDKERIEKIKKLFASNIENNDIRYIFHNEEFKDVSKEHSDKKFKVKMNDPESFKTYFLKALNPHAITTILEYVGISSYYTMSTLNSQFKNMIKKKFKPEHISKYYCDAVFNSSKLYNNDLEYLKSNYHGYFDMILRRPRIKFGGIYYSLIKFTKKCDPLCLTSGQTLQTVIYFRYLQFFPDGTFACVINTHQKNSKKLLKDINSGLTKLSIGKFYVDYDCLICSFKYSETSELIYKYEIKRLEFNMMKFNGLELLCCDLRDNYGNSSEFKLNENFPRIFKYRSLNCLEKEYFIKHKLVS